jgi:hypothetical protein
MPAAIASATHRRPAASKARRQHGRQNTCRFPPVERGVKRQRHQARGMAAIAEPVIGTLFLFL